MRLRTFPITRMDDVFHTRADGALDITGYQGNFLVLPSCMRKAGSLPFTREDYISRACKSD